MPSRRYADRQPERRADRCIPVTNEEWVTRAMRARAYAFNAARHATPAVCHAQEALLRHAVVAAPAPPKGQDGDPPVEPNNAC